MGFGWFFKQRECTLLGVFILQFGFPVFYELLLCDFVLRGLPQLLEHQHAEIARQPHKLQHQGLEILIIDIRFIPKHTINGRLN